MPPTPAARPFEVRHVQLARAVVAAIAAVMITFSSDHSAPLGLATFSGFAIMTAFVLGLAAWLVYGKGNRAQVILPAALSLVAGMVAGIGTLRTDTMFFALVTTWAVCTGVAEAAFALHARRVARTSGDLQRRSEARDGLIIGILGVVLAAGLLLVPAGYALNYTIAEAHRTFTLTGITIGVGIFGGYAAIVAVYLGIAGFSPRTAPLTAATPAASDDHLGGAA